MNQPKDSLTSYAAGQQAEQAAAVHLTSLGYEVLDRNWKTRWCEGDIVARKGNTIYFVEVKYRSNGHQGNGFDYITSAKQLQMARAAESWVQAHSWEGDYQLSAAEVSSSQMLVHFIADI